MGWPSEVQLPPTSPLALLFLVEERERQRLVSAKFFVSTTLASGPAPKFCGGLRRSVFYLFICTAYSSCNTAMLNYKCGHDGYEHAINRQMEQIIYIQVHKIKIKIAKTRNDTTDRVLPAHP